MTDDELVKLIRRDAIDVLVDLGGHTARNRLLALARKPAPVQIAHFLGHGYTSGLSVMDAFLADEELAPAGAEQYFSEPLIRLPRIPISYTPPAGMPPVSPLPALKRGHVTFGHFGRVVRINEQVVAVWARILGAVPRSRLVLNTVAFMDEEVCRRYRATVRGPRHHRRPARPRLHDAPAQDLGCLCGHRHLARSVPSQRRHDDDRGGVARRAVDLASRPALGRPLRRKHSCRHRT